MGNNIKNAIIEEQFSIFKEDIFNMLNEDCGISNEVAMMVYNCTQVLLPKIEKLLSDTDEVDENNVRYVKCSDDVPGFKRKISLLVTCYDFNNKNDYSKLRDKYNVNTGTSACDGKSINFVNIICYSINGKVNKEKFTNTLSHELHHIFKQNKYGDSLPKDAKYYNFIRNFYYSDNKDLLTIARILYYSEKFEQEAFSNGLYNELFINKEFAVPTWEEFKKTNEWEYYTCINDHLSYINKHKEEIQKCLDAFLNGMSVNTLIKIGKRGQEEFKRKLIKVFTKIRDNNLKEGIQFNGNIRYSDLIA